MPRSTERLGATRWPAALAAAALVLAGCGAVPHPTPARPAGGLSVGVEQSRDAENRHLLELVVRNDAGAPVRVRSVQLRSPLFVSVEPAAYDDEVRPGTQTLFAAGYGPARCDADGAGAVAVQVADEQGVRLLPVAADDPFLRRTWTRSCRLERLADEVAIGFGSAWRRDGEVVRGTVELRRRSGTTPVRLERVYGSQTYSLVPDAPLPFVAPDGTGTTKQPVHLEFPVCEPHQVIESKRNLVFDLVVQAGDGEPLVLQPPVDAEGAALAQALLQERCAAGVGTIGGR